MPMLNKFETFGASDFTQEVDGEGREDGEDGEGDVCGICRVPFEGCCPQCKLPGDDCPLSKSYIQLSNLNVYLRIQLFA